MRYLIDTNVLVHALDANEVARRARAIAWLTYVIELDVGMLSSQALSDLANVCLDRLRPKWTPTQVSQHLSDLSTAMEVLPLTAAVVMEALRGVKEHHMSYFDAQMWGQARLNQIPYLLTEDMDPGTAIDGVLIVDPFAVEPPDVPRT